MEGSTPAPGASQPGQFTRPVVVDAAPRRRGVWGCLVISGLLVLLLFSLMLNLGLMAAVPGDLFSQSESTVRERFHSMNRFGREKVAIIEIEGTILETEGGFVKKQIDQVVKDEGVKGVVLRVNSPGGTVSASDYLLHHLQQMTAEREIPLVVSMGGICASGGYYVSMAVGDAPDTIYAEPTTWTGSIGVVIPHYDLSGLLTEWKIADDSIKSAPLKTMGSPTKPMTEEERAVLQGLVDDSFKRFKEIVVGGRPVFKDNSDGLDKVTTGQIFTADQAVNDKIVDRIGFLEDAIDRVIELASLDRDQVRVVKYAKPPTLADALFGSSSQSQNLSLAALLDLSAPQAYYIYTTLPAALTSRQH
ncbi:MAG: signal peptide peptidase SppA [Pirellulales bacterium]|nr:signal peptide peptidase SppA [Pirellulales bacterium]